MKKKTTLKDVLDILEKFQDSNDSRVQFFGGLALFDKDCEVIDDRYFAYGCREALQIDLDEFNKIFKEDKSKFINW